MGRYVFSAAAAAACLFAALSLPSVGCSDAGGGGGPTTRQSSADRALADPWGYGPKVAPPDKNAKKDESPSDRDSLKRELDNVFNP